MREILFRGKCKDNGEWIEARGIIQSNDFTKTWFIIEDSPMAMLNIVATEILTVGQIILREVIPETVGQYTGLTDKNGKMIFEGDILDWDGYKFKKQPVVTFGLHKVECCGCCYYYHRLIGFDLGISDIGDTDNCEVIGNIHDNPELLGGDDNDNHT